MPSLSWNGYELDGSDTSFEVAFDEVEQARAALAALLRHPLWDASHGVEAPPPNDARAQHRYWREGPPRTPLPEALARAQVGELDDRPLILTARSPASLDSALLERVARHSPKRQPLEPAYVLAQRPCFLGDGEYFAPRIGVVLQARPPAAPSDRPLALQLIEERAPRLELTLGPTFIYEYAMELVEAVGEAAPGARVEGGLDCANGWTWGCTYAGSLYPFAAVRSPLPADQLIPRLLDSALFARPLLRGGCARISWYEKRALPPARDVNFAASGGFLLEHLEAGAAKELGPSIERFIDQGDQATREQYLAFCRSVQSSAHRPAAKRDLSLIYLLLPSPGELPEGARLRAAQVELLRPLYADGPRDREHTLGDSLESPSERLCWLGLDPEDAGCACLWVRPTVARYAQGVLELIAEDGASGCGAR